MKINKGAAALAGMGAVGSAVALGLGYFALCVGILSLHYFDVARQLNEEPKY